MRRGYFLFLPLVLLSLYAASYAQNWSGVLSPDRAVDWSQTGVLWSIPNRTTVCASLNPGATEAQITSAITSCPAGQVVFLNAGTYTVASLNFGYKSNVTLRGAGADKTKIVINGNTGCHYFAGASACLSSSDLNYSAGTSNSANWTAGYSKGTTVITLSSTANLAPGKMLILDQLDDKSDTGQMFVCETAGVCSYKGESGSQRAGRGQQEVHKIVSVSGNQVTIAPGLQNPNWSSGKSPQAWWPNSPMMNSGIEDMTIDQSANGGGQTAGIMFMNSVNCWLKGVRSINAGRNHVMLWATFGTIIRDSYFYGAQSTASTSYGIEWYTASNTLLENNIFQHVTAPITINGAGTGDVIAYNFAIDDNYTAGGAAPGWMQPMIVHHSTGDAMQLFEGNDGLGAQADNVHGTHNFSTYYRNYFYGDIFNNPPKTGNTELLHFWAYSR
jgi:hypothetical protein